MPYIQLNDQQFPLGPADLKVGAFEGAEARLPGEDPSARAVLRLGVDGVGLVSRGNADSVVHVNGVLLGAESVPLLHGDRIELGGHELRYGADQEHTTKPIPSESVRSELKTAAGGVRPPSAATGGRVISLVDGREYAVPLSALTIGREIGCGIVIGSTDVSRVHARIAPTDGGYVLTDLSTNGVLVNQTRVQGKRVLSSGDVLVIGPEEFRFHADIMPAVARPAAGAPQLANTGFHPSGPLAIPKLPARAPTTPPVAAPADSGASGPGAPVPEGAAAPDAGASGETAPRAVAPGPAAPVGAIPAVPPLPRVVSAPPAPKRRYLATLEITNEGPTKGTKFELFGTLTNIGRGGHNDVVVNDESVSVSHAKVMRRDGVWWLVDQDSTNGTYVGGRRVQGEHELVGAPDVRFGGIKMIFRAVASAADDAAKGTRAIAALSADAVRKMATEPRGAAAVPPPVIEQKKGCASMVAFLMTLAAVGTYAIVTLFLLRA